MMTEAGCPERICLAILGPVRIVYVADAPRLGGAERYLVDVIAGVLAAGHWATLISPQRDLLDYATSNAPGVITLPAGNDAYARAASMAARVHALVPSAVQVARAIRRADPGIVHINNGGYPGSDLCRLSAILAQQRPAVMSVHSIPWKRTHSDPRVQAVVDRALWRSLDMVAGATRAVGAALIEERGLPAGRFQLLPYGVREPDGADECEALRARLCPDGELLIGMIAATADEGKGHRVLLDAVRRMRVPVHALIIGADPGPAFESEPRVTVLGRVPSVGPYVHAVDVLVVPSTQWESLPLVILEAMAARRPVIGSRIAGLPEAVSDGETGRLLPPGDADALAAALDDAARDRATLAAMGAAGRKQWARAYSSERMVGAVLDLYRALTRR